MKKVYKVLHLFGGIGGGSLGFSQASLEYRGIKGSFENIVSIDVDFGACKSYEKITNSKAVVMDLFSRQNFIDFHGEEPPTDWKEVTPEDILAACEGKYPDVIFLSPPCKGLSSLLGKNTACLAKYQALNELTLRGVMLVVEAFKEKPPIILLENVPRIKTRGKELLKQIEAILEQYGYLSNMSTHDCGEIGGISQRRKRFLLIARHPKAMLNFIYEPVKYQVKPIKAVLGHLPMPDDPAAGKLHRLPNLAWKTWVRLALIPEGRDWRALEEMKSLIDSGKIVLEKADFGKLSLPDIRLNLGNSAKANLYRVQSMEGPAMTVTGAISPSNGATCIGDDRFNQRNEEIFRIIVGGKVSSKVPFYDPRLTCKPRAGAYGVMKWDEPAKTVIGSSDVHAGYSCVADTRVPCLKDNEKGKFVILSFDGKWHRPLTTLELAVLQSFPTHFSDGSPFELYGNSDAKWREWIGNAVPPAAAQGIAESILKTLIANELDEFILGDTPIWVDSANTQDYSYIN